MTGENRRRYIVSSFYTRGPWACVGGDEGTDDLVQVKRVASPSAQRAERPVAEQRSRACFSSNARARERPKKITTRLQLIFSPGHDERWLIVFSSLSLLLETKDTARARALSSNWSQGSPGQTKRRRFVSRRRVEQLHIKKRDAPAPYFCCRKINVCHHYLGAWESLSLSASQQIT